MEIYAELTLSVLWTVIAINMLLQQGLHGCFEVIPDCHHSHGVRSQFRLGKCRAASRRNDAMLGLDWVLESVVCRSQGCCQNHVCATTGCGLTVSRFWWPSSPRVPASVSQHTTRLVVPIITYIATL